MKLILNLFASCVLFVFAAHNVYAQAPIITSFNPATGSIGTLVTITGTNLSSPTAFTIGGVAAVVVSNTATSLVGMVMPGTASGAVTVTNGSGSASGSGSFVIIPSFLPSRQQGNKIVGTGSLPTPNPPAQGSAVFLSADGNTAISGATGDNGLTGASWIFVRSGGVWAQQAKLVGTGILNTNGQQGFSAALNADGNTAIVGSPYDGNGTGAAWIFTRSGTTWTQQTKLTATGIVGTNANVGWWVALSADGNTALVGAYGDNSNQGAAFVFTRSGTTWTQQAKLIGTGNTGPANQGGFVSLSANGNTALVGGAGDNASQGASWVFTRSGTTWTQQAKLVGTGNTGAASQGICLALNADGNTAAVGGYNDNNSAGSTWIFTRSGTTWTQQARLMGTGATGNAGQGWAVALSADGNTAAIGGYLDNSGVGATWLFTRSGTTWTQQGSKFVATGAVGSANQGYTAALSADGNTLMQSGYADNSSEGAFWINSGSLMWTGGSSTSWSTAGNWSPAVVPTSLDYAVIPVGAVTNEPTLSGAASVGYLEVETGHTLTLGANLTVSNTIGINGGMVVLGANTLTANTAAGGFSTSYIKTNSTGVLTQLVNSTAKRFPLGNTSFNPATLTNTGTADNFSIRIVDDVLTAGTTGTTITASPCVKRTWMVSEASTGANVSMVLQWNSGEPINTFDASHVYVAHYKTGAGWENYNQTPASAPAAAGSGPFTVTKSGLTSFSPFTVASNGAVPLSVRLTSLTAVNTGKTNHIDWTNAIENAGDVMVLERSTDGSNYSSLASFTVHGIAGSSYSFTDQLPAAGINYYRMRTTSTDGMSVYSKTATAIMSQPRQSAISIYPNPATDKLTIQSAAPATIRIIDIKGSVINTYTLTEGKNELKIDKLIPGQYIIEYTDENSTSNYRLEKL